MSTESTWLKSPLQKFKKSVLNIQSDRKYSECPANVNAPHIDANYMKWKIRKKFECTSSNEPQLTWICNPVAGLSLSMTSCPEYNTISKSKKNTKGTLMTDPEYPFLPICQYTKHCYSNPDPQFIPQRTITDCPEDGHITHSLITKQQTSFKCYTQSAVYAPSKLEWKCKCKTCTEVKQCPLYKFKPDEVIARVNTKYISRDEGNMCLYQKDCVIGRIQQIIDCPQKEYLTHSIVMNELKKVSKKGIEFSCYEDQRAKRQRGKLLWECKCNECEKWSDCPSYHSKWSLVRKSFGFNICGYTKYCAGAEVEQVESECPRDRDVEYDWITDHGVQFGCVKGIKRLEWHCKCGERCQKVEDCPVYKDKENEKDVERIFKPNIAKDVNGKVVEDEYTQNAYAKKNKCSYVKVCTKKKSEKAVYDDYGDYFVDYDDSYLGMIQYKDDNEYDQELIMMTPMILWLFGALIICCTIVPGCVGFMFGKILTQNVLSKEKARTIDSVDEEEEAVVEKKIFF